ALQFPSQAREAWHAFTAADWMSLCGIAVLALALLSALVNHCMDLSQGWILRFVCGVGLAVVVGRTIPVERISGALAALLVVGVVALGLSVARRADSGLAHFTWPIGPITITASMAGVWAAMAAGMLAGKRRFDFASVLLVGVFVLSSYA